MNESFFEIPTGSFIQLHSELGASKEPMSTFEDSVVKLEIVDGELICHTKCHFSYMLLLLLANK